MTTQRDNVKAGIFVVLGLVLGILVLIPLTNFRQFFEDMQQVRIYYLLADGLRGLKPGAEVTLGGQPVGTVTGIKDFDAPDDQTAISGKIITAEIPKRIRMYWNARIELVVPAIGSGTNLNIASVGDAGAGEYEPDQRIPEQTYMKFFPAYRVLDRDRVGDEIVQMKPIPDGAIPGGIAGSQLARQFVKNMGIQDTQRLQVAKIIANVQRLTDAIADADQDEAPIERIVANLEGLTGSLKDDIPALIADVRDRVEKIDPILAKADAMLGEAQHAMKDMRTITTDLASKRREWIERIDNITARAESAMGRVDQLLADKDPDLREAIDNIREITQVANDKTMTQITEALDSAGAAMEKLESSTAELEAILVGQRPVIERAIGNFQLTAAQLKLAAIEVRRSPWRLLYQPDDKELATDNLYDAARSYAQAASVLEAAASSLQAVQNKSPDDQEQVNQAIEHLETVFTKYREAEQAFWEALEDNPPAP